MDNLLKYLIRWNREMQKRGLHRWYEKNMFKEYSKSLEKEVSNTFYGVYMPLEDVPTLFDGGDEDVKKVCKPINVTVAWK